MWILWVPVLEKKISKDFHDSKVSHEKVLEEKAPTERKLQEHKEKMMTMMCEEEESFLQVHAVRAAAPPTGAGSAPSSKRSAKGKAAPKARAGDPGGKNVVLEAARFKASTIKDCGLGWAGSLLTHLVGRGMGNENAVQ